MTKQSKKKNGKRSGEVHHSEGGRCDGNNVTDVMAEQSYGAPTQSSCGHTVDLSFFRVSSQLCGELHQRLSHLSVENYTEESVMAIGRQVLETLTDLAEAVDPQFQSKSSCPFVMLLSMLLPTLRKYMAWTQATRSLWGSNFDAVRNHGTTSDGGGALCSSKINPVLWVMLAQHDILTRFLLQTAHIIRLIKRSESIDRNNSLHAQVTHPFQSPNLASPTSSASSSCSSVASTPRDPRDSSNKCTPRISRDISISVPQIAYISTELANVDAECKTHLADLTESLIELVEMIAKRMCLSTASNGADKSSISAREYVERLVQHLLEPMGQRMLAEPSASFSDVFPRLLEQCITVTLDNFARSNKQNGLQAASFEAACMHLRTWSLTLEAEYNTLMKSMSNKTDSSMDTSTNIAKNCLNVMALGGFKRLEITLDVWLHATTPTNASTDSGSATSARSWGVPNLGGGLRSTMVRTFTEK